jgi:hypothetical protein
MAASADNQLSSLFLVRPRTLRPAKSLRVSSARTGRSWRWGENLLPGKISQAKSRLSFISHHLSNERFGGSPAILGSSVTLEGVNYSITVNYVTTRPRNLEPYLPGFEPVLQFFHSSRFPASRPLFITNLKKANVLLGRGKYLRVHGILATGKLRQWRR